MELKTQSPDTVIVFVYVKMYVVTTKNEVVASMDPNQVDAIFERMYATCGVVNDYQLAKYLGVKASSVKGWKIAKHPPFKACYEIFTRTGVTIEWLITGQTPSLPVNEIDTINHVAEREAVYRLTGSDDDPDKPCLINMPLEQFQSLFRDAIVDGISSQFFDLLPGTDRRAIDALAARFYRKVNDPVVLPDTPDENMPQGIDS